MKNNAAHGTGRYEGANYKYTGGLEENVYHGKGVQYAEDYTFDGQYKHGKKV